MSGEGDLLSLLPMLSRLRCTSCLTRSENDSSERATKVPSLASVLTYFSGLSNTASRCRSAKTFATVVRPESTRCFSTLARSLSLMAI